MDCWTANELRGLQKHLDGDGGDATKMIILKKQQQQRRT